MFFSLISNVIGYKKAKSVFLPYLFVLFLSFVLLLMKSVGSGNNALHTHVLSKFMDFKSQVSRKCTYNWRHWKLLQRLHSTCCFTLIKDSMKLTECLWCFLSNDIVSTCQWGLEEIYDLPLFVVLETKNAK